MECFVCQSEVLLSNPMANLSEERFEEVVNHYGLIRLEGPEEQFDSEGYVVICADCIEEHDESVSELLRIANDLKGE